MRRLDLQAWLTGLAGVLVALGVALQNDTLAIASCIAGAPFALEAAWGAIKERRLDVNFLMVLAAAGAVAVGHPEDAAVLLFLFALSGALESRAMARTRSAIEQLVRLRPDTATRLSGDEEEEVPVEDLNVGDRVRVNAYGQVPADGIMESAQASIDESAMTGESTPALRVAGQAVLAGTHNLDRPFVFSVSARNEDSTLSKILGLVEEAQENKASGERISAWFGQRYTIAVVLAFLLSFVVRAAIGEPAGPAFYASLILLVALSPCALVISTPAATLSALAHAARKGILVRGGKFIEEAGRIDTVAFDKTGTLTVGRPRLLEVCSWSPEADAMECWRSGAGLGDRARRALAAAAAAEEGSSHPIAGAIREAAESAGAPPLPATNHRAVTGYGVEAEVGGEPVRVGQAAFFDLDAAPEEFRCHVEEMRGEGLTAVIVQDGLRWSALGLGDEQRGSARETVRELRGLGLSRIAMLTGDNAGTAARIASRLEIPEFRAGLLPPDKTVEIAAWTKAGRRVMMVGDGVNDAPALAAAHLGVAMGGLGSDVAMRAADVVLVQDRIERLPDLIRLGRRANRIIRANLLLGSAMIVALAVGALFFSLPLPLAVVGHEGSTVLVILNGLRLLR